MFFLTPSATKLRSVPAIERAPRRSPPPPVYSTGSHTPAPCAREPQSARQGSMHRVGGRKPGGEKAKPCCFVHLSLHRQASLPPGSLQPVHRSPHAAPSFTLSQRAGPGQVHTRLSQSAYVLHDRQPFRIKMPRSSARQRADAAAKSPSASIPTLKEHPHAAQNPPLPTRLRDCARRGYPRPQWKQP